MYYLLSFVNLLPFAFHLVFIMVHSRIHHFLFHKILKTCRIDV